VWLFDAKRETGEELVVNDACLATEQVSELASSRLPRRGEFPVLLVYRKYIQRKTVRWPIPVSIHDQMRVVEKVGHVIVRMPGSLDRIAAPPVAPVPAIARPHVLVDPIERLRPAAVEDAGLVVDQKQEQTRPSVRVLDDICPRGLTPQRLASQGQSCHGLGR